MQTGFAACYLNDRDGFFFFSFFFCLLSQFGSAEAPPRVFNSPYATISLDYNPVGRMSEYKVCIWF